MTHKPQLDGLRALAVAGVIAWHTLTRDHVLAALDPGMWGVRLFFVLSGFLITGILWDARAEAGKVSASRWAVLRAFYARRSLRIFPLYYFALLVAWLSGSPDARGHWPWYAAYLGNILVWRLESWPSLGHFWSLAVEEQFYLAWPAVILFSPRRAVPWLVAGSVAFAPAFRAALFHATGSDFVPYQTPGCLDALGAGGLLALLHRHRPKAAHAFAALSLAFGVPAYLLRFRSPALDVTFAGLGAALVSAAAVHAASLGTRWGRPLGWRPLAYVGTVSYGVYVWHPMLHGIVHDYPLPRPLRFLLVLGLAVVAASASWYAFEKPINSLKRFFPYVRRGS